VRRFRFRAADLISWGRVFLEIKNSVFLVTGGASGLGFATAKALVQRGADVVIADMNEAQGAQRAAELGGKTLFCKTDVSSEPSAQSCIEQALARFKKIDGLVNCAGVAPAEKVLTKNGPHTLQRFQQVININLIGTFNMIRLVVESMSQNPLGDSGHRGLIVTTASVAAFEGQIGQAAYSASKGGVMAMTLPVARELSRYGIRLMCIAPGIMETPMLLGLPAEVQDGLGKMVPFPARLGRPGEYASLVLHIAENDYLNGETIRLDGALRMAAK